MAAITGASSGIGLACAELLAREGAAVALGARRADRLQEAVARIRAAGGRAEAVTMDVTVEHDVNGLVDRAVQAFGTLERKCVRWDFLQREASRVRVPDDAKQEQSIFDGIENTEHSSCSRTRGAAP